ncbi:MAG TPA: polyprenol monophosphomannose synthase [Acidimicrobiales bacterium]
MRVLVVLPTYNECENIDHVLRRVRAALPEAGVLVVDDGSPDGTADLAEKLGDELGNIEVLRRRAKSGLGSAYRAGFAWGLERDWEAFVEMDADLSHEPEALPTLIAPLSEGVDLVVGSRYVPGGSIPNWRWHRRLLSQGGNVYAAFLLRLSVTDSTSGFRAYRAEALRRIDLGAVRAEGYGFQIEMVYQVLQHGGQVAEVPIRFVDRVEGKSKMSMHIVVEALLLVTWWACKRVGRILVKGGAGRAGTGAAA